MLSGRGRVLVAAAGLVYVAALASQCSKPPAPTPAAPAAPVLLGDMKPVFSVKELMEFVIDPISDNVFDAVYTDITPKGVIDVKPRNDADWEKVRVGAATLAEAIYLLKVPRLFAPQGDVNNSTGPNPPELSPTQIKAMVDKDPVLWNAKIEALRNVALEVMDIVKKRDIDELFNAGEDLDKACESCHLEYWYPGDRAAVDEDARQRAGYLKKKAGSAKSEKK